MSMVRRFGTALLLLFAGFSAASLPTPARKLPVIPPIRLPEGIADPTGSTGYFASATGGIEALDLANGKVLWQTHEANRPLLLDGDHLLAQAGTKRNRLRILCLDVKRNGECDLESDPIVFPAWVVTGEAHGHSFSSRWHLAKHQLILDWDASAWYIGKMRPTADEESAARKYAHGIAHIDLRTGQIDVLPTEEKRTPPADPPALPEHWENKSLRWQGQVGHFWKVLALEEEKGQQRLMLHSWDRQSQKEQQPKELLRGQRLQVRATLDERILCLRESRPRPDDGGSWTTKKTPNKWLLFSVQTGELLGRIPDEAGMNTIAVLGPRVYYLVPGALHGTLDQPQIQPQTLKAFNISSGNQVWERPVVGKLLMPPPPR